MIKQIEETFKIKLPQDYIKYMKENNGYTGDNYYDMETRRYYKEKC